MPKRSVPEKDTFAKPKKVIQKPAQSHPVSKPAENDSDSESSFSFEQGVDEENSSDFSSSHTDEFATGKLHLTIDPQTLDKAKERVKAEAKDVLSIKHTDPTAVIYLSRIPYGFEEQEIQKFFSQFGDVLRVKLGRSKRGKSKHYAYVEFVDPAVAKVAADTMDNYILFNRMIKCQVVPPERMTPGMFLKRKIILDPQAHHRSQYKKNMKLTPGKVNTIMAKEARKHKKLKEAGIEYSFPGLTAELKEITK
eukprot:TRINITY_DN7162_c0_g1_i7.p1 TRINITY_DN7162_c0_g1~~TRINITY_DN7162_c0_g1_i7.p1  ORF type:complete len:251 (+),score=46.99 TRINITY_DN7162_c0_g1_i7:118-870(+)